MKITYEFDTTSEDFDRAELLRVQKATEMTACIYDIENKLRGWYKYDPRNEVPIDEVREEILEIIRSHDIDTDVLYP